MRTILLFNLHSTMFLLIQRLVKNKGTMERNLHSTMFLLIHATACQKHAGQVHLHSTMFLLIPDGILYYVSAANKFTFHNVSINTVQ